MSTGASWRPDDMVAGGLIDDVDARIVSSRLVEWDYQGKIENPVLALKVEFQPLDEKGQTSGDPVEQHFSAGELSKFQPSPDGKRAVPVGNSKNLNNNSNAALFVISAVTAGFPPDKIGDDVSVLEGMVCHVNRVTQPKRRGLAQQQTGDRAPEVLVITKIHSLPWEKKAIATTTKAAPRPAAAPAAPAPASAPAAAEVSDDVLVEMYTAIGEVLASNGGKLERAKLQMAMFKQLNATKSKNRTAILNLVKDDANIAAGAEQGLYRFDGTVLSAA